jgi:tRNA modification GTPase
VTHLTGDTIFAMASGTGRAGVAVYRLSGPLAGPALRVLSGRPLPEPRRAKRVRLFDHSGDVIDDGLALWFPGPASFTGEDVVELQLHGGLAVAAAITEALLTLELRPAEPGEFSRRAFEAGKLDLTQAEAVADLVDAETAAQRRQALRQLDGALSRLYDDWRTRLIKIQAHMEAAIDFADEDLPADLFAQAHATIAVLADTVTAHLRDGGRGERLREGLMVAIVGAPNVGKSSLLNRLAGREAAIVSTRAGTTRDVVEVHLELAGYPLALADTAGIRETADEIEAEGMRRALLRAGQADLRLVVLDGTMLPGLDPASLELIDRQSMVVINKIDQAGDHLPMTVADRPAFPVSALSGKGIEALANALGVWAGDRLAVRGSDAPVLTRARHRVALEETVAALRRSHHETLPELIAEDVRLAAQALGRITGRVDVEDVLDVLFGEFCIGK